MIGICALCKATSSLQNSHLVPKWAYRRALSLGGNNANAPVLVSKGNAVLSNKQTTKKLLCSACEQRFSTVENYIAKITKPDNSRIKLFQDITRPNTPKYVLASLNRNDDGNLMAYFAASVMWRSCVMTGQCKLGPYQHIFQQYLSGQAPLPPEVVISACLFEASPQLDPRGWISEPTSLKTLLGWLHGFLMTGLGFRCWIGKTLPHGWSQVSLSSNSQTKYVSVIKPEECADFIAAAEVAEAAKQRGRLAA